MSIAEVLLLVFVVIPALLFVVSLAGAAVYELVRWFGGGR